MTEQNLKVKIDPRIYWVLGLILLGAAAVGASGIQGIDPQFKSDEQILISSNVVQIDAEELRNIRQNEAKEIFTLVNNMESGHIKAGAAKKKIQDYKYNAKDFNPANAVETEVNQIFINFCNSAIDCTNMYYYGLESEQYMLVYGEMMTKKELI